MVYTLTFNPAIDYVLHIDTLNKGEINRSKSESIFFGGKGINVSLILKELGIPSTALGFVAGFTGQAIENGIRSDLLRTDFIHLKNGTSRINVKLREKQETDINASGPQIGDGDIKLLFEKLEGLKCGDVLVLAGSVPAFQPKDIYERILDRLKGKGILFVVDAEGDLLINSLKYKPFLIKPNNDEMSQIFGVKISDVGTALQYAEKLQSMGACNVLVSMGAEGAVLLDQNGNSHRIKAASGKKINTVGAGDSMVAGFIAGYINERDFELALRLGNAAGGATAFSEGLATREEILKLL